MLCLAYICVFSVCGIYYISNLLFYTVAFVFQVSISLITAKATHIIWPPSRWQKLNTSELDCDRVRKGPPLSEIEELVAV